MEGVLHELAQRQRPHNACACGQRVHMLQVAGAVLGAQDRREFKVQPAGIGLLARPGIGIGDVQRREKALPEGDAFIEQALVVDPENGVCQQTGHIGDPALGPQILEPDTVGVVLIRMREEIVLDDQRQRAELLLGPVSCGRCAGQKQQQDRQQATY